MLDLKETEEALQEFVDYVVRESKRRAPKASSSLKRSIRGEVKAYPNSIQADIYANDYLPFIDKGVKGSETSKKAPKSPFKYTNKKPPLAPLVTWAKRKSGKFLERGRKNRGFALQNHIFKHGIKTTNFFTDPFEQAFRELPDEVVEAYGLDIENFMDFVLNENK